MELDVKSNVAKEHLDGTVLHHARARMVLYAQRWMGHVTANVVGRGFIVKTSVPMVIMGKIAQRNVDAPHMPYVTR